MRYFFHWFFVVCLTLNLVGPSVSVLANAENNKQLICSVNGFEWVSPQQAQRFYQQIAQQAGVEYSPLESSENQDAPSSSRGGHCPLCIFNLDIPTVESNSLLQFTVTQNTCSKLELADYIVPVQPYYLTPEGRAPPIILS